MKSKPPRFELLPATAEQRERWPELGTLHQLVCREDGADGRFLEHDHGTGGGHCFPLTRVDAIQLLNQLVKILYQL